MRSFYIMNGAVHVMISYKASHALQPPPKKQHHNRKHWERVKFSHRGRAIPCFGGRV